MEYIKRRYHSAAFPLKSRPGSVYCGSGCRPEMHYTLTNSKRIGCITHMSLCERELNVYSKDGQWTTSATRRSKMCMKEAQYCQELTHPGPTSSRHPRAHCVETDTISRQPLECLDNVVT